MTAMTIWGFGQARTLACGGCLLFLAAVVPVVYAQPGPPGQTESDKLVQAHRAIQSAKLDVRFATYYSYPDETDFITTTYSVVLDRANKRLRIDRPGYTLLCDGKDVVLTADTLPGRHLRMPLNGKLNYQNLLGVYPDLANPTPPGVIMLLAEAPIMLLSDGLAQDATALGVKQVGTKPRRSMSLPMQLGSCELSADPKSRLLDEVLIEVDPKNLQGSGIEGVRFHYVLSWSAIDQPVDASLFDLDLKRSHEMTTLAQFLSVGPGGGVAAGGGQGPGPGNPAGGVAPTLLGMPLPDVELTELGSDEKTNLMDQDQGVVIVEFYASWTKASTLDLPALTDFKAWAEKEKKDVSVFAVAVGETKQTMTPWLDALEKTAKKKIEVPILLDTETKAAMAMGLPTVPRTIIAIDGRVVDVYGGVKPNFLDDLKKGLPGWLEKVKDQRDEAAQENASEESKETD